MTPLPWVARILPQRLVLPDLQNLHSLHSGVLESSLGTVSNQTDGERILEGNDVVARLYVCDTLADRFDDTGALVTENDGEGAFGILAG